ncbi:olfactory receptor 6N1-like [Lepisosteus oculatus]|nr:PREDICTED: olfactory receptor 6N1-like [Lepisosteus oculatus]
MSNTNHTVSSVTEFIIIGFPGLQDQGNKTILFSVFLVAYLIIVLGNLLIIFIFVYDESLHTPMYILICNLAVLDICLTTITLPKMLALFLFNSSLISFNACFTQMFFFLGLGVAESFLLTVMAYDRYLAICKPLHYHDLMTNSLAIRHVMWCWVGGFLAIIIPLILALRLPFCGPDKILHCFCDHSSVLRLACANVVINSILGLTIALSVVLISLLLILLSYMMIIKSVLVISTSEGRTKAFSTCTSHLLVISVFFLTAAGVYISYRIPGTSEDLRIMAAVFQNVFPPLMNPIIYCLRTKEIRDSFVKILMKRRVLALSM